MSCRHCNRQYGHEPGCDSLWRISEDTALIHSVLYQIAVNLEQIAENMITADQISKLADDVEALLAKIAAGGNSVALQAELDAANVKVADLTTQLSAFNDPALEAKVVKAQADVDAANAAVPPAPAPAV